jgi:hypothetical protein
MVHWISATGPIVRKRRVIDKPLNDCKRDEERYKPLIFPISSFH